MNFKFPFFHGKSKTKSAEELAAAELAAKHAAEEAMPHSRKAVRILLLIALVLGFFFIGHYLAVFALAALFTIMSLPLHKRLLNSKRWAKLSTAITIICILLVVIIPVTIILAFSFNDLVKIVNTAQTSGVLSPQSIQTYSDNVTSGLNSIPGMNVSRESIQASLTNFAKSIGPALLNWVVQVSGNVFTFFIDAIIFFMAYAIFLSRGKDIMRLLRHMSPFSEAIDDEYVHGVQSMAVAMVKGTALIALVIATISTFSLWIIGFPYLSFWFVIFFLMSFVPLGAGIIYIPLGIILVLTGSTWQGVFLLLTQLIVLNNVDNVLRPRVAPKEANLPAVLILVGAFSGVHFFGTLGVIYGPIIMILLYTTVSLYDRHRVKGIPLK